MCDLISRDYHLLHKTAKPYLKSYRLEIWLIIHLVVRNVIASVEKKT